MLVRDLIPAAHALPTENFIRALNDIGIFGAVLPHLATHYSRNLPMHRLLQYLGHDVAASDDELQISCPFSTHGTADVHKSARYYNFSRDGDEREASVHCFKCGSRKTTLWLSVDHCKNKMDLDLNGHDRLARDNLPCRIASR